MGVEKSGAEVAAVQTLRAALGFSAERTVGQTESECVRVTAVQLYGADIE